MFRRLFQNLDIKIVSLLIALLLWAHVVTDKDYESAVPVFVRISGLRPGLVLLEDLPQELSARIKAKGRDLVRLHFRRFAPTLKLDLSSLPVGRTPLDLQPEEIEVPAGITAKPLRFLPSVSLNVTIDTLWERRIKVHPEVEGDIADGFVQVGSAVATPEWVTLKGPKQTLLRVEGLMTHPISLDEHDKSFEEAVALDLSGLRLIRAYPETVTVSVGVEAMLEKVIERIPVRVEDAKHRSGASLEPPTIKLIVQGRAQEIGKLRERSISAVVDVSSLPSGTHELPARIELPKGFVLKSASPEHFRVVLK